MAVEMEDTKGDPYLRLLSAAYLSQQAATGRILKEQSGTEAIQTLMGDALTRANRVSEVAMRISPPERSLACAKGCGHCCWATVGVVAPDAIYLAEALRRRLPDERLASLRHRSGRLARRLQRMGRGERLAARLPCLLLEEGSCSAYEHRTLVCRWACSPSLQDCLDHLVHRTKAGLEMEDVRYQPTQEVWRGLRAGLREAGLDGSLLSLNGALAIALAEPDAAHRYLQGEPLFVGARLE